MNGLKIFLSSFVLIFAFGVFLGTVHALTPPISNIECSLEQPCPEESGLECFHFPEIGLRCAVPNPCSYYHCPEDAECVILETYPARVHCSPTKEMPTEIAEVSVSKTIEVDEDIQPEHLEISEPRLLPDSPFYFLKNWTRAIRNFFTLDPVKKAELKMKFANEKLMETKKMIEEKKDPEKIKQVTENYQKEVEEIKKQAEKIREKAGESPQVESFLDKFLHQQTLHQKLLQRLETQAPTEAFEKIKEAREEHLERFKDVMLKLEDRKEVITEKLDKVLKEQRGSDFKDFKNLEILKNLEEKVPEEAKEAIQKVQEMSLKRLKENLENMPAKKQEQFKEYIEGISGEKEKQLEILEDLKSLLRITPETPTILQLKNRLEGSEIKIFEKIKEKADKKECPPVAMPMIECGLMDGRWIYPEDPETGCPLSPICVFPGEVKIPENPEMVCITLWNPVCGKDGKTYSNECFAELAGVEIDYKGVCEERLEPIIKKQEPECKLLWWFDNERRYCQQKQFCGMYMYLGLHTFETEEECERALNLNR